MDKYEYQLKTEHIRQVAARKEYGEAAKLCDTIDWTKIRGTPYCVSSNGACIEGRQL